MADATEDAAELPPPEGPVPELPPVAEVLPASLRNIVRERAAQEQRRQREVRAATRQADQLAADALRGGVPTEHGGVAEVLADQADILEQHVRRRYLALLCEEQVLASIRTVLENAKKPQNVRAMLATLSELVVGGGGGNSGGLGAARGGGRHAVNINFVNKVPRPQRDVTPRPGGAS